VPIFRNATNSANHHPAKSQENIPVSITFLNHIRKNLIEGKQFKQVLHSVTQSVA